MTLRIPNCGELELLRTMLGGVAAGPLTIHLYSNDITPANDDETATYTEVSGMGYAPKTLLAADWTFAQLTSVSEATNLQQTWTFTAGGPITVYGYYITGADDILRWAERFIPPFSAEIAGDMLRVTPKITFSTY